MDQAFNFEENLKRLEEIIKIMESKTLPLQESISLYEEGTKILLSLEQRLSQAEAKISEISKESNE